MHFISVMAVTEPVARERIAAEAGYDPATIETLVHVAALEDNSRQHRFVFQTTNDVTQHPHYAKATLLDVLQDIEDVEDGPVLVYGPEVTVGG